MANRFFAWLFKRIGARNEARGGAALRRELLAGARGRVLEVGAGTGLNFPHYPPGVDLTAVEPEPALRAEAAKSGVPVLDARADRLPLPDGSVDEVVVSGVLCSVPDQAAALAEFRRVLRPGGRLRFYEHVRARSPLRARWQDLAALVWPRLMGGCLPNRDTRTAIEAAGFVVSHCRELIFPPGAKVSVVAPRIVGIAQKGPNQR